jgi:hypothetical protein
MVTPAQYGTPASWVEPNASQLEIPAENQLLYKITSVENFLSSIKGNYLYFNRVDFYKDFPGADSRDGEQLLLDRPGNASTKFHKQPGFTAADYYDQSRSRSYACCFSMENSPYIWKNYGVKEDSMGKICIVFNFGKLRKLLNYTLESENAGLVYNGILLHQIFSINYGLIKYVNWENHQINTPHLPSPIEYLYTKDINSFSNEKEFRISLSAIGIGSFVLNDRSKIQFSQALSFSFDYHAAIRNGVIQYIKIPSEWDPTNFYAELKKLKFDLTLVD